MSLISLFDHLKREWGILLGIWSLGSLLKMVAFLEKHPRYQKIAHSDSGRAGKVCREKSQKNTHSENGRVGRLRREKSLESSNVGVLPKELKPLQFILLLCKCQEKIVYNPQLYSESFCKCYKALCNPRKSASSRRGKLPRPRKSTVISSIEPKRVRPNLSAKNRIT